GDPAGRAVRGPAAAVGGQGPGGGAAAGGGAEPHAGGGVGPIPQRQPARASGVPLLLAPQERRGEAVPPGNRVGRQLPPPQGDAAEPEPSRPRSARGRIAAAAGRVRRNRPAPGGPAGPRAGEEIGETNDNSTSGPPGASAPGY